MLDASCGFRVTSCELRVFNTEIKSKLAADTHRQKKGDLAEHAETAEKRE